MEPLYFPVNFPIKLKLQKKEGLLKKNSRGVQITKRYKGGDDKDLQINFQKQTCTLEGKKNKNKMKYEEFKQWV